MDIGHTFGVLTDVFFSFTIIEEIFLGAALGGAGGFWFPVKTFPFFCPYGFRRSS